MKYTAIEQQLNVMQLDFFWQEFRNVLLDAAKLADEKAQTFSDVIPPWQKVDMTTSGGGWAHIIHMKSARLQHPPESVKVLDEARDIIVYAAFKLAFERMNERMSKAVRIVEVEANIPSKKPEDDPAMVEKFLNLPQGMLTTLLPEDKSETSDSHKPTTS